MSELNIIRNFASIDNEANEVIKAVAEIGRHAMCRDFSKSGLVEKFSVDGDYNEKSEQAKIAVLKYCGKKTGIVEFSKKADVIRAFENRNFADIYNSIMVGALESIVLKAKPEQILRLANIISVDVGDSYTWEIDTKGLPIAQRASYTSNVAFLDGHSKSAITITPKPYSIGTSMDYIRILDGSYDMGVEIARVAMGLLYAQLKLIVLGIYSTTPLTGTPLYQATFDATKYIQMGSDIAMLNGGSAVTAYGTLPAFHAIGVVATTNYGFQSQDEMIREGFLGRAYGIDNVVIDQLTDLSAPFINANAADLRLVPNDRIVLLSSVGDKPAKLVRENFIRVKVKEAADGAEYRYDYKYFMSFDAAIATQAHYGIQAV